jgi:hypothetical protein
LAELRTAISALPLRKAFYPGGRELQAAFIADHPRAELYGHASAGTLPWVLIAGLDPGDADEMCFTTESFCPVMAETALEAGSVPEFIERAVHFANERLWGTLTAVIVVHPDSMRDPDVARSVEKAITDLRYGVVVVNTLGGVGWALAVPPWGSFPGNPRTDIQSGTGFVNNALMFSEPEKIVLRSPFMTRPPPIWFSARARTFARVGERVARYEASPSWPRLAAVVIAALRDG